MSRVWRRVARWSPGASAAREGLARVPGADYVSVPAMHAWAEQRREGQKDERALCGLPERTPRRARRMAATIMAAPSKLMVRSKQVIKQASREFAARNTVTTTVTEAVRRRRRARHEVQTPTDYSTIHGSLRLNSRTFDTVHGMMIGYQL